MDGEPLCPKHEAVIRLCVQQHPHLDETTRRRLRTDYARFCRPGTYGCTPHPVTDAS